MIPKLADAHGRTVRYLRLSVTDRCNLRCLYCAHALGLTFIPHENILSYEEMLRIIGAAVSLGVDKVRLTGGEPFARKGFVGFLESVRRDFPTLNIRITTNATLAAPHMPALQALGINALNISFDTFRPETFRQITGKDQYAEAERGLYAALASGIRVKINAVALKGVNDDELPAFFDFLRRHPVDVRFIEYMPLGGRGRWTEENFWPATQILAAAEKIAELTPLGKNDTASAACAPPDDMPASGLDTGLENGRDAMLESGRNAEQGAGPAALAGSAGHTNPTGSTGQAGEDTSGPARLFQVAGAVGRFGVITPLSNHFCGSCNRIRVTSDGRLRTCLFSDVEYPFRDMLRDPAQGMEAVIKLIAAALAHKPLGYRLLQERTRKEAVIGRSMSSIGG